MNILNYIVYEITIFWYVLCILRTLYETRSIIDNLALYLFSIDNGPAKLREKLTIFRHVVFKIVTHDMKWVICDLNVYFAFFLGHFFSVVLKYNLHVTLLYLLMEFHILLQHIHKTHTDTLRLTSILMPIFIYILSLHILIT